MSGGIVPCGSNTSKGLLEKTLPSATLCWGGTTAAAALTTTDLGSFLPLVVETGIMGKLFGHRIRPSDSGGSSGSSGSSGARDAKWV